MVHFGTAYTTDKANAIETIKGEMENMMETVQKIKPGEVAYTNIRVTAKSDDRVLIEIEVEGGV